MQAIICHNCSIKLLFVVEQEGKEDLTREVKISQSQQEFNWIRRGSLINQAMSVWFFLIGRDSRGMGGAPKGGRAQWV